MKVEDLTPGDVIRNTFPEGPIEATFVARTMHPLWPHLELVIWRMQDGSWSHDALDRGQEIGDLVPCSVQDRTERLRAALFDEGAGA